MSRTPTLSDVATHAGVSYATADRVVNARGGVAEKSRKKVHEAIAALGYVRNVAAANLSQQRTYRFGFVLPAGQHAFFDHMRQIIRARIQSMPTRQVEVQVFDVDAFDADALCARLDQLRGAGLDGIAVVGVDDPAVAEALMAVQDAGTTVVSLVSDVSATARAGYVGVDNIAAGRTAGRLIGMAHAGGPGTVQIVIGSAALRDHAERLASAQAVLAQDYPLVRVLPFVEGLDQDTRVAGLLDSCLLHHPEITAIYGVGAGNDGIFRTMANRAALTLRPFCVVHELTPASRQAVEAGLVDAVIDQQPETEIDRALALMRQAADRLPFSAPAPMTPTIYLRDNLPAANTLPLDERPPHD